MPRATAKAGATTTKGIVADKSTVSAEAGAEATAVGDATLATGFVKLKGRDVGPVTLVSATAEATAAATGADSYAGAGSFAQVQGADLVISRTVVTTAETADGMATTSVTRLFAIDIDAFDFAGGTRRIELYDERGTDLGTLALSGSVATVEAHATAAGDATYALALTDAYAAVGAADITGYAQVLIG
jgi:hypothetical protein